jgi:DNA-binding response OmpR family regulator
MIEQHQPDCIIVDILMPGLDGYQFVSAMRGDPNTAQIPLVILSALVQEQDRIIGLLRGADAYLTKPIEFSHLVATINDAVALTREQRSQIFNQRADELLPGEV